MSAIFIALPILSLGNAYIIFLNGSAGCGYSIFPPLTQASSVGAIVLSFIDLRLGNTLKNTTPRKGLMGTALLVIAILSLIVFSHAVQRRAWDTVIQIQNDPGTINFTVNNAIIRTKNNTNEVEKIIVNGNINSKYAPVVVSMWDKSGCDTFSLSPAVLRPAVKKEIVVSKTNSNVPFELEFKHFDSSKCVLDPNSEPKYQKIHGNVGLTYPDQPNWRSFVSRDIEIDLPPTVATAGISCQSRQ